MVSDSNPIISVVIPVYGCSDTLMELYIRLKNCISEFSASYEIVMVNDGSTDNAWNLISEIAKKDNSVLGINLSRNFGQHNAITAGLDFSKGEWVVIMDCDGQDQPEEIIRLYDKAKDGYDYVLAQRSVRNDTLLKRFLSRLFHWTFSIITKEKWDSSISNFGIYNRKVINSILQVKDSIRWFPTFLNWVGYNGTKILVNHSARINGKSSYSYSKLINIGIDVIILNSERPLKLIMKFGLFISLLSFIACIYAAFIFMTDNIQISGWIGLILSLWFLCGIIIFSIGITGLYIGKIFNQTKQRPLYIIKDIVNE